MRSIDKGAISARVVFRQNLTSLGTAKFGKRSCDRRRQCGAAGNCRLNGVAPHCHPIRQIGIDQKRRQRVDRRRDLRLVRGQCDDDGRRRGRTCRQRIGERTPHQRRWIVEKPEHQAFRRRKLVGVEFGTKIGAAQGACRLGALIGRRSIQPMQEIADDRHWKNHTIRMRFQP